MFVCVCVSVCGVCVCGVCVWCVCGMCVRVCLVCECGVCVWCVCLCVCVCVLYCCHLVSTQLQLTKYILSTEGQIFAIIEEYYN